MDPNTPVPEVLPVPTQPKRKKLYFIIGGCIAFIVFLIPIIIGILTPAQKVANIKLNTKPNTTASPAISATQNSPEPTQSAGIPSEKVTPYFQITPVPTIDLDSLISTKPNAPTPTHLPGPFFTNNGKQNDLFLRLYQEKDWDQFYQMQLINARTREVRIIGYQYLNAPGDSAYFSHDFSQVIFLGGKKTEVQALSFYSIPYNTIIKSITLSDMKNAMPEISINLAKTLSRLVVSPDGRRAAVSYGFTYNVSAIEPTTDIFIINLQNGKMKHLAVHGLSKDWKDNTTLEFEINSSDPAVNTTSEVAVPNF